MSFTWNTMALNNPKRQEVDVFPTLGEVLECMAALAWEDATNKLVDYVTDDALGTVAAVAIFGPGKQLLVTCADGRRLSFKMPERYED
jgi:hypothetical protein